MTFYEFITFVFRFFLLALRFRTLFPLAGPVEVMACVQRFEFRGTQLYAHVLRHDSPALALAQFVLFHHPFRRLVGHLSEPEHHIGVCRIRDVAQNGADMASPI